MPSRLPKLCRHLGLCEVSEWPGLQPGRVTWVVTFCPGVHASHAHLRHTATVLRGTLGMPELDVLATELLSPRLALEFRKSARRIWKKDQHEPRNGN